MYTWQFGTFKNVVLGRTWEEYQSFIKALSFYLEKWGRKIVVYIHNTRYEWGFMRHYFDWSKVFFIEERYPLYFTQGNIMYKDSLRLAGGKSLDSIGKGLRLYNVTKATGDLDYKKVRTPITPLTEKEIGYCIRDIQVLSAYIEEKIIEDKSIANIPLTNTGYVRRAVKGYCLKEWESYSNLIDRLKLTVEDYAMLLKAYRGGDTHANPAYVGKVLENVESYDIKSSYPAVMVSKTFPMSAPFMPDLEKYTFEEIIKKYHCIFKLTVYDIMPKVEFTHPLSWSTCVQSESAKYPVLDNGRVVSSPKVTMIITEIEYDILRSYYNIDESEHTIADVRCYEKKYLPRPIILAILEFFNKKTTLDGVEGKEKEYMISKNMLNSIYGMMVMRIIRDKYEWINSEVVKTSAIDLDWNEALAEEQDKDTRFLYYAWGIYVTSWARYALYHGISELKEDFVYCDTDSVKGLNMDRHREFFNEYNEKIKQNMREVAKFYGITINRFFPKAPDNSIKYLGVYEYEGRYTKFKTLGAKRYLIEKNGEYKLTVAGTNKVKTMEYLKETFPDPFKAFDFGLQVPPGSSGRSVFQYIDDEREGIVTDYKGLIYSYKIKSGVHSEESTYEIKKSPSFEEYIRYFQQFIISDMTI